MGALEEVWRLRQLISLTITAGKVTSIMLALESIDKEVDVLVQQYAKEGRKGSDKEISASLDKMIDYLNKIAWNTHKAFIAPTGNSAMKYALDMAEASWARLLLTKIYNLEADGMLPSPGMPWVRRREMLVGQRDALIRLGIQMEGAIRRTDAQIVEAGKAEDAIRRAAWDPITTKEELLMLNEDWTEWINSDHEAREWKARFACVLKAAKQGIEALSNTIETGDKAQKKKH